jgi:hypothetical protein
MINTINIMEKLFNTRSCNGENTTKKWTIKELKNFCKLLQLSTQGNKEKICNRISEFFKIKDPNLLFSDFVEDNDLEYVKNYTEQILIEQFDFSIQKCISFGLLDMLKLLLQKQEYTFTFRDITLAIDNGFIEMGLYIKQQLFTSAKIEHIDNLVSELYKQYNIKKPEEPYIAYINLSKILKSHAELYNQMELFTTTF